jgi:hypothetical protein
MATCLCSRQGGGYPPLPSPLSLSDPAHGLATLAGSVGVSSVPVPAASVAVLAPVDLRLRAEKADESSVTTFALRSCGGANVVAARMAVVPDVLVLVLVLILLEEEGSEEEWVVVVSWLRCAFAEANEKVEVGRVGALLQVVSESSSSPFSTAGGATVGELSTKTGRERGRERQTETDSQKVRQRQRQRETEMKREGERKREREKERDAAAIT